MVYSMLSLIAYKAFVSGFVNEHMTRKGIPPDKMAKDAELDTPFVKRIMSGQISASYITREKIMKGLHLTAEERAEFCKRTNHEGLVDWNTNE